MFPRQPEPLRETDQCVRCGLCLPHCPTYTLARDENESPRGRIALMQGLRTDQLRPNDRLRSHLAHCLTCRACEDVCPAGVPYGQLIDATRAMLVHQTKQSWYPRLLRGVFLDSLLTHPGLLTLARAALRLYQQIGLRRLVRHRFFDRFDTLRRMDYLLPDLQAPLRWHKYFPPLGLERGQVGLFKGCVAAVTDPTTLSSAIRILTRLGFGVHIPRQQTCCGALHLHSGYPLKARQLADHNVKAFSGLSTEAILSTASGCGAVLADYPLQPEGHAQITTEAAQFAEKVQDISQFLYTIHWPEDIRFSPLAKRVAVHDPCSLSHVLHQQDRPYALLNKIPSIQLVPLADNGHCCGAAGLYMLAYPKIAEALLQKKLFALKAINPEILVTSNIGCALHLAAGIRQQGMDIEVMHPVTLLARQMQ